jgi:hypothetical protein
VLTFKEAVPAHKMLYDDAAELVSTVCNYVNMSWGQGVALVAMQALTSKAILRSSSFWLFAQTGCSAVVNSSRGSRLNCSADSPNFAVSKSICTGGYAAW